MSEPKYPYRHLTAYEFVIGVKCQRRVFGEYDTEVTCSSPEGYDRYTLTDEIGWYWIDTEITDQDIIHVRDYFQFNINGIFRIKT
jgi:hypothetical protein